MSGDRSWAIMLVANPALRERKQLRLIRRGITRDPIGLAEPLYQLWHRDQVVLPSALDQASRELLTRAQAAVDSALSSVTGEVVDSPDIVAEPTLRRHEWQIATALRDITDLRAEHELNAAESSGPMTAAAQAVQESMRQVGLAAAALALAGPATQPP